MKMCVRTYILKLINFTVPGIMRLNKNIEMASILSFSLLILRIWCWCVRVCACVILFIRYHLLRVDIDSAYNTLYFVLFAKSLHLLYPPPPSPRSFSHHLFVFLWWKTFFYKFFSPKIEILIIRLNKSNQKQNKIETICIKSTIASFISIQNHCGWTVQISIYIYTFYLSHYPEHTFLFLLFAAPCLACVCVWLVWCHYTNVYEIKINVKCHMPSVVI